MTVLSVELVEITLDLVHTTLHLNECVALSAMAVFNHRNSFGTVLQSLFALCSCVKLKIAHELRNNRVLKTQHWTPYRLLPSTMEPFVKTENALVALVSVIKQLQVRL